MISRRREIKPNLPGSFLRKVWFSYYKCRHHVYWKYWTVGFVYAWKYCALMGHRNGSDGFSKSLPYQRWPLAYRWRPRNRTPGNRALLLRIQAFPSSKTSRSIRPCSKCSIVGMPTTSRDIWRYTGNRPNCWWSSVLSSLTAGSNSTILTLTGILELLRWG